MRVGEAWFWAIWMEMLRKPGVAAAVVIALSVRLRRWSTRIYRSLAGIVVRGLLLLVRS